MTEGSGVRILLVDPDGERASTAVQALENAGFVVEQVQRAEGAYEAAGFDTGPRAEGGRSEREGDGGQGVDCVVAADELPDTDCLSLLERVRERAPDLPFVLAASDGSESLAAAAIAAGVTDYVVVGAADRDADGAGPLVGAVESATGRPASGGDERADRAGPDDVSDASGADSADESSDVVAEMSVDQKASLLDSIFESIPVHLFVKDRESRHAMVSKACVEESDALLGLTDLEVDRSIAPEGHARRAMADDRAVLETGEPILDKEEFLPEREQWNLTSKVPWRTADGDIRGVIGVSWDITERKRHREALERQNDRLDEFASIVSHDLRGPLNVASGYLGLARAGDDGAFERVEDALDRMDELIDDVLAMARQGQAVLDRRAVSLSRVARDAWQTTETGRATLVVSRATVEADESQLKQLFENLFSNAVEHGGEAVTVEVGVLTATGNEAATAVRHGDGSDDGPPPVGFYVADDGPGIQAASPETVFETGYTSTTEGTGFGLAIVERIAQAHGWDVSAETSAYGGARFDVEHVTVRDWSPGDDPVTVGDDVAFGGES